jgi:hypothetical protein
MRGLLTYVLNWTALPGSTGQAAYLWCSEGSYSESIRSVWDYVFYYDDKSWG